MAKSINTIVDPEIRDQAIEDGKCKLELYCDRSTSTEDKIVHIHGATRALFGILPHLHYFSEIEQLRLLYIRIVMNPANPFVRSERDVYIDIFEHN